MSYKNAEIKNKMSDKKDNRITFRANPIMEQRLIDAQNRLNHDNISRTVRHYIELGFAFERFQEKGKKKVQEIIDEYALHETYK